MMVFVRTYSPDAYRALWELTKKQDAGGIWSTYPGRVAELRHHAQPVCISSLINVSIAGRLIACAFWLMEGGG